MAFGDETFDDESFGDESFGDESFGDGLLLGNPFHSWPLKWQNSYFQPYTWYGSLPP